MNNNLSAGNAYSALFSQGKVNPVLVRKDLAKRITKYINHSRLIMMHSHSDLYKKSSRWYALDFAIELLRLCGDASSLRDLCKHTLRINHHLYTILPLQSNTSYESSKRDLDGIVADCKNYLKPITYE